MEKKLYLECTSGISGDMTTAALLDLGADQAVLEEVLNSLPLDGYSILISRVKKSGIDACDFNVVLDKAHENHDHDMEYLHGHHIEEYHQEEHDHDGHMHSHGEHDHHHHHEHRGMAEITEIINRGTMTEGARNLALKIFGILAQAEAKAHHVPVEQVHFHEVGAVDSIVDIVSAAVCLDNLGVTEVIIPVLCEGQGTIRCQHGILPVPVPATANILSASGLKFKITEVQGELVTPTGAAIAAAVCTGQKLPEHFAVSRIGIGAGKRNYECPGILRAMLLTEEPEKEQDSCASKEVSGDTICKLETNIDDCTGETLGYLMEQLFAQGAKDVHYQPVFMKKNRPAWLLTVICSHEDRKSLEKIIFRETTTIGIRYQSMDRTVLQREFHTVETPYGPVKVKICRFGEETYVYPEYESAAKISRQSKLPYREIYRIAEEKAGEFVHRSY